MIGKKDSLELAKLTGAVGTEHFYPQIAEIVGKTLDNDRTIVSRYSRYDLPEVIVNNAVTDEILKLYYGGFYRLDALYSVCRTVPKAAVVTVMSLGQPHLNDEWVTGLLRMAQVSDEIALLLPAAGETTMVVSCVRPESRFSTEEVALLGDLLPLLEAIHEIHLDQVFSRMLVGVHHERMDSSPKGSAIFNHQGDCVYSDEYWQNAVAQFDDYDRVLNAITENTEGDLEIGQLGIVHWGEFRPAAPIINLCKIAIFERFAEAPVRLSADDLLSAFQEEHHLTPREIDVVREVVAGYPNELIAARLGITVGTVKNCRWRLYYKLDITTERELFCMFLNLILQLSQNQAST